MKRYFFFMLLLVSILSIEIISQQHHMEDRRGNPRELIDQLEKIKLIEELQMSEEVSIKFFSRRNEFREKEKKLNERIESLSLLVKDKSHNPDGETSNAEWKRITNEFIAVENSKISSFSKSAGHTQTFGVSPGISVCSEAAAIP